MSETPADRHNRLSREFVQTVLRDVLANGGGSSEVMVVLESTILSAMLVNAKAFGLSPAVSSGLVESAVQRAIERFSEQVA